MLASRDIKKEKASLSSPLLFRGEPHIKVTGMLVRKLKLNP